MIKEIKEIINLFADNQKVLDKILVSAFINTNSIKVSRNRLIKSLIVGEKSNLQRYVLSIKHKLTFDELIEAFELAISTKEKVVNGAVYTPNYIKSFIVDQCFQGQKKSIEDNLVADISCGCGAFLFTVAKEIKAKTNLSFSDIFRNNIFGLDITQSSIDRTKILLSLLALSVGEDKATFDFNLICDNALSYNWNNRNLKVSSNKGFDIIVGNPPYVRAKNIDLKTKELLSNWSVTKSGNPDLYIPFFEVGLTQLNSNGILGYITVNTFFKSMNARALRKYIQDNEFGLSIIDFGDEKMFDKKSAYTCICFLSKKKSKVLKYKRETSTSFVKNGLKNFNKINLKELDSYKGWLINSSSIVENIKRIENTGNALGQLYRIKNGIATLSNDIYIFRPISENDKYYILNRGGKNYEIEKDICRDIIKPNILKHEEEINSKKEKIIYPYTNGISPLSLMNEKYFKSMYPKAYKYLLDNKSILLKRDKGNGEYGAWYAFGRTQALTDKGFKLLFPYMAKRPYFVVTDQKEMLIYCGYAIFHESLQELQILKRILESKVFYYYIANTSKPYSSGYYSYAKNYVKNFGLCELNKTEKEFLLNGASEQDVDEFLIKKYSLKF